MLMRHLILMSLLTVSFCASADAAEPGTAADTAKPSPAAKKTTHKHKNCAEKKGQPCPSHKRAAAGKPESANSVLPATAASAVAPGAATTAVAATVPVAPSASPSKTETTLPDADGRALAQRSGCFTCHAIDRRVVGPAWKAVADKYRGDSGAAARLVSKVKQGGSGVWGSTAMPANAPRVSDADTQALVRFILSLR